MKLSACVFLIIFSLAHAGPDFVLEMCRHGARSVESTKYDDSWGDIGYGELTSVGMRQHYVLGMILGQEYPDLLYPYNPDQIRVFASGINRTLMSASSQLFGIYEGTGPSIPGDLAAGLDLPPYSQSNIEAVVSNVNYTSAFVGQFQPIPIHSTNPQFDYLLQPYTCCPALEYMYQAHINDNVVQEIYAELNETIAYFKALNYSIASMKDVHTLGDTALSAYFYGKPLPANISVDSQIYQDLLFADQWYEIYATFAEITQRQVYSAPPLSELLSYIQSFQNNTSNTAFVLWSGHETSLFTILSAFNITTPECMVANWRSQRANQTIPYPQCIYPAFADNLIFEYYNTTNPYVIVKYGGTEMTLCGNSTQCSLEDFTNLVQNVTNGNTLESYYSVCNVSSAAQVTSFATVSSGERGDPKEVVYAMGAIIVILSAFIVHLMGKNNKIERQAHQGIYVAQRA